MAQSFVRILFLTTLFAISAVPAAAQDDPRFALVTSFPTPTVSVQWDLSDRFAVRFEGSYNFGDESAESDSGDDDVPTPPGSIRIRTATTSQVTVHNTSFSIAGIYNLHRSDQLRLYVTPRVGIAISKQHYAISTAVVNPPPGLPPSVLDVFARTASLDETSSSPTFGASFGAATHVNRRLALFGEAGFNYSSVDTPTVIGPTLVTSTSNLRIERSTVSTRAVGGVMLYF